MNSSNSISSQSRMKHISSSSSSLKAPRGRPKVSYYQTEMARIYCTDTDEEPIWKKRERRNEKKIQKEKEKEKDSNLNHSPSLSRSCDDTINTSVESKGDDEEAEAALEAFAWFKGEQKAAAEVIRLRDELKSSHAEIDRLNTCVKNVTAELTRLQVEVQSSQAKNLALLTESEKKDKMEEMARKFAHSEALWLSEKKELNDEIAKLKKEIQLFSDNPNKSFDEKLSCLRDEVSALQEENEVLQSREESIKLRCQREYAAEINKLQTCLHEAREAAQTSNVHTVQELNRLQSNHDVALAELENLKEELKLAKEEASWLRADKVIAEEGAKVKEKIAAASVAARWKEIVDLKEANAELVEEIECMRAEMDTLKKNDEEESIHSKRRGSIDIHSESDMSKPKFSALYNRAVHLHRKGRLTDALPCCQEALSGLRATLGDNHPDTLCCIDVLATILYNLGELEAAEPLAHESYNGMKAKFGSQNENTLSSMINLAVIFQASKKLNLAEPLFREFFSEREGVLSDSHPTSLRALNNLSLLLQSQGDFAEAEPYCRRALEYMRSSLGDLHPDTLQSISNLAMLLYGQGKMKEAEPLCYEALSGMRTTLGNSHMSTLASVSNLAMLLQAQKKLEEAEPYCREALAGMRNTLGNTHSITLASLSNLAMLLFNREQYEEAESLYIEAFESTRDTLGDSNPSTLTAMNNLALIYQSRGNLDGAETLFRECLKSRQDVLGDTHPETIRSLNSLACLLQSQGKVDEAEDIYRESFALVKKRAEASALERSYIKMKSSNEESSRSDGCYSDFDEEALILGGTLSTGSIDSSRKSTRNVLRTSEAPGVKDSCNDSHTMLSSSSSTARALMQNSSSPKPNGSIRLLKCAKEHCRKKFTSINRYISHLRDEHKDPKMAQAVLEENSFDNKNYSSYSKQDLSVPSLIDNVFFGCKYNGCAQLFKNVVDRDIHIKEAHMDTENCNASISSISSNSTGTGTSPFPYRKPGFLPENELKAKKSASFRGSKDYICFKDSCHKSFKTSKDRINHMKDAHGYVVRVENVTPPPGLEVLSPESSVEKRIAVRDKKPVKETVCPFSDCKMECKTKSDLISHISSCHGEMKR